MTKLFRPKNGYFFVLLFIFALPALADSPAVEQISSRQGLSQNTVRCILQDKKGFLWFGTINGLNRYDGYRFVVYKPEPGKPNTLSDHRIKDLFEDSNGHIWIKTYNNKFNCFDPVTERFWIFPGTSADSTYDNFYQTRNGSVVLSSFRNGLLYLTKSGNEWKSKALGVNESSNSISNNRINFTFDDSHGNLWFGTRDGLNCLSASTIKREEFRVQKFFEKSQKDFVFAFEIGKFIYFVTRNHGVFSFNTRSKTFVQSSEYYGMNTSAAAVLSRNEILLATRTFGLLVFRCKENIIVKPNFLIEQYPQSVYQMFPDNFGGIWFTNATGNVWRFDIATRTGKHFMLIPPEMIKVIDSERINIYSDPKKNVWITTYSGGLYCYNSNDGSMHHYSSDSEKSDAISSNYVLTVTSDRSGNIWIGTELAGINKISFPENKFKTIYPAKDPRDNSANSVRAIFEDRTGGIWVSTKDGKLHLYNSSLQPVDHLNGFYRNTTLNSNVYCFFQDHTGKMWLGTKGEGIYCFHPEQKGSIQNFRNEGNSSSLSDNQVYDIQEDGKHRIWITTFGGGLNLVQQKEGKTTFKKFFDNGTAISQMRCLMLDREGKMWVGTNNGIIVFDPDKMISNPADFKNYTSHFETEKSLLSNEVKVIYQDKKGDIWIGTSGGLNKYVPASGKKPEYFEIYSIREGLANDVIGGIMEDNHGNLWLGTESGISRYNPATNTFENFRVSNNIQGNIISESAYFKRMNGEMLWGSKSGFYSFSPEQFEMIGLSPPVILTNFSISGNPVKAKESGSPLTKSITYTDKIVLDNSQRSFSIEFATLSYTDQQRKQYSYILENYETDWNQLVNYNIATYKNLPPGNYTFRVKLVTAGQEKVTSLQIKVLQPFWRSETALGLYAIVLLLVILSTKLVINRIHKLQSVIEIEKQLADYKVKFFTNISHEFRTPLFLIQASMEAMMDSIKLPPHEKKHFIVMQRNTNRLLILIEQLLDFSKVQNKKMKLSLQQTDVSEFLQEIYSSFSELAEKKKISFNFIPDENKPKVFLDKNILDKILYNLLSNAFKFTPEFGRIDLKLSVPEDSGKVIITVSDTGTGIPKDKQTMIFTRFAQIQPTTTGIGLSLARELAELHKGGIRFESTPGAGSIFEVTLTTDPGIFNPDDFAISSQSPVFHKLPVLDVPEDISEDRKLPGINSTKILIIEDNQEIRSFLVNYLGKLFNIEEAANGVEGLKKAVETEPDLIVCDIMMPEMDGIQVTEKLKNDFQTSHIPIILLTAMASDDYQMKGTEAGADAYITKPFSARYLMTKIIKLIEQREALRKKYTSEPAQDTVTLCKNEKDKEFLDKAYEIAQENLANADFSVDDFARLAGYGRTIFFKKLKGITGNSPNEYIRIVRLKKALELLQTGKFTVSEVSYKVGITDPFYFSRCFKSQFGHSPSSYLKKA